MKHIEGDFRGCKNLSLYYQSWLPSDEIKAVVLVVHGLAEHSGRYLNMVNRLVPKGYVVYGFDQRGHGHSQGLRGYVEQFSYYVNDLGAFLDIVRNRHRDAKIFIVGHSLGGTIATAFAVHHQSEIDGLILSGAVFHLGDNVSSGLTMLARVISLLSPTTGISAIDASATSRDKSVVNAYSNDPLVYRGKIRARLGTELMKTIKLLPHQMANINLPILIMHGTDDRLSDPSGSEMLYSKVGSRDKTLKLYSGLYHELFNEPEGEQVLADMEAWLAVHI